MDISIYFDPVNIYSFEFSSIKNHKRIGDIIKYNKQKQFPDLENIDIALIGINEERAAVNNKGCSMAPDYVRECLYKLYPPNNHEKIADLGNIKKGFNIEDTYFAVSSVIAELFKNNIIPVIIGGSQDLTYANYQAYAKLHQTINIVSVDSSFDIEENENQINSQSYLNKILLQKPNFLFNYTNIGYQTYFVNQDAIQFMKNLFFDVYRLGKVRANLDEAEPMIRNADMLTFDLSSVRQSDAPANGNASPNGFYGEEICQIIRYAGLSDKLTSIGFYELNPSLDKNNQSACLVAQMIWYFIDGFYNRKKELPFEKDKDNYVKYIVPVENNENEIVFLKSKKTNRWWMEIKWPSKLKSKHERNYLVPCSYSDYKTACENDVPDRWWQVYQKLM